MIYLNNKIIDEVQLCKVEGGSCNLVELNATENKIYTPEQGVDGFSKVTVNTPYGGANLDWASLGLSEEIQRNYDVEINNGYNYAKEIQASWDASQTDLSNKFKEDKNLLFMPMVNTSSATNMYFMFYRCSSLQTIPKLDTSKVTNTAFMLSGCDCKTIPLLNISNVTDMHNMFSGCSSLITIPKLNTSKAQNMSQIFLGCKSLVTVPALDLSSCTDTNNMFGECTTSLQSIALTGDPSKITNMSNMFGRGEIYKLAENGTLIYDHRYDYTAIINELHKYNPTWTAKPDNQ